MARVLFLMAVTAGAACGDAELIGPDAQAADAGAAADAAVMAPLAAEAPVAPPRAVVNELTPPPALLDVSMVGDRAVVVLDLGEGTAVGPVVRVSGGGDEALVMRRAHQPSEAEAELLGQPLRLHERDGGACEATITGFAEVASIYQAEDSRLSLRKLWDVAVERGGVHVVAELSADGCQEPLFADEHDEAGESVAPRRAEADSALARDFAARLRALPRFAAHQQAYAAVARGDGADPVGDWSEGADLAVTELRLGDTEYVTAALHLDGSCDIFGATLFTVWKRGADGSYTLLVDSDQSPGGYDLAFDADEDGIPELAAASPIVPVMEEEWEGCGC